MKIEIRGEAAQEALGQLLAGLLRPPLILWLEGDLGTGKTTLTRGILRGLGHGGAVRSPTFTLLEPYELGPRRLYHLDLYRLGDPEELEYLGLRDLLERDSILIVEWPRRGGRVLPAADLEIRFDYRADARALEFQSLSPGGEALVMALAASLGEPARSTDEAAGEKGY
ncbi:MAG: tRNA (adenosine(37)-N6)-threonylcarbamoyltransferase complex ATPase subunit type 1 TsaE [Gammaproteobacteria bacterium]|jgi:tRNA threonylcarbamoyladenosine biosynthesis protein TsaE|nr:tRNA (adenosine(37)-N6)-threonylcarbamoyltransferase complex ATPase subunit type 1 TsaE [Candidatus Thioaporhodococcus sediminis]TNF56840.1 MAG: tRNA (adenosine(37)-N6)-threonylcarbamoyltransferase complex ATPase subunit type 1 TsaE [Gammaproteobacteria bacterium]